MRNLLLVNSTVCGHLIVAWAMVLNAVAHFGGGSYGAAGVACGAASLAISWGVSGQAALTEDFAYKLRYLLLVNMAFTLASWLLWLVPALIR